jgi:hypothetical protein
VITLVPPHGDSTLRLGDDEDLDLNAMFLAELMTQARDSTPAPMSGDRAAALLRNAGAAALRDEHADRGHRLRGLAAILTGLASPEHGVRLRLDDLELTDGSTQSSADVFRAGAAPAPYHAVLERAAELANRHRDITLVLERDQQLPAAVWLADHLGTAGRALRVTGRFATSYWTTLRTLPPFTGAALDPAPRGLEWRVVDPFTAAALPTLRWRERAADPAPPGPWAGRVALREIMAGAVTNAHTVILGLCTTPDCAVGRGGTTAGWQDLAAALDPLRRAGVQVLAELWIGAPGIDLELAPAALRAAQQIVGRVTGFRVFDWPVGWTESRWDGQPVRLAPTRYDLARHHILSDQAPAEQLIAMVTALARPLARDGLLVPGRIAAAYLTPPPRLATQGPGLDPDVVLGARSTRTGKGVAVNLRTGACTTVDSSLSGLIDTRPPASTVRDVLAGLAPELLPALRDGDVLVGMS